MPKKVMPGPVPAEDAARGGGVIISPSLKRRKDFINVDGDIVKPFTKEVIRSAKEDEYVPSAAEIAAMGKRGQEGPQPAPAALPGASPIGDLVRDAIQAEIQGAVLEALKEIDMGAMVRDAIKGAFKPKE